VGKTRTGGVGKNLCLRKKDGALNVYSQAEIDSVRVVKNAVHSGVGNKKSKPNASYKVPTFAKVIVLTRAPQRGEKEIRRVDRR